jgi:tetratricopeptide (TPR) repeat protein
MASAMTHRNDLRRKQALLEAEGYLDLIMVFADQWPPTAERRDILAQRALDILASYEDTEEDMEVYGEVMYLKGQALRAIERYEEALLPLQQSADACPTNIHIWLALGWCYKRCGRIDLAIEALEEGWAVDDGEAIFPYNLACYWALADNVQIALDYLSQALDMDPNFRDVVDDEADFDAIRNHPEFQALVSVIV